MKCDKSPIFVPSILRMKHYHYTLSNGLRIIYEPTVSNVAYCGFIVNAGTRDENEDEQGMAHFIEHMLFKGTAHRKAWHILNRMESVGGELNAYTTKEETVIYSAFLTAYFSRAFELLTDIVFYSSFPQKELEKERKVVLDEIRSYEDVPSDLIFDEYEELMFEGHALGKPILGTPQSVQTFDVEKTTAYYRRFYRPDNMVFFVRGNLDFKKIVRQAEQLLYLPKSSRNIPARQEPTELVVASKKVKRDTSQAHVVLGHHTFGLHDSRRLAFSLLNNILGGPGMNSRLNVSLREQEGLVYSIESNLTLYSDSGLFSIYFGTNPEDYAHCLDLIHFELKRLRTRKLSSFQLNKAKKQFIGQLAMLSDQNESAAIGLGRSYLHYNRYNALEDVLDKIEKIESTDLLSLANEFLHEDKQVSLSYL